MKRCFFLMIIIFLILVGCSQEHEVEIQNNEVQNLYMQPKFELEGYSRLGNLIYNKDEKYYSVRNNQLSEIELMEFESSIIYKDEKYNIQFKWCIIDEEVYVVMEDESIFSVDIIESCNSTVLLNKYLRLEGVEASFLCNLEDNTISWLLDKDSINCDFIESVKVSSNLKNVIVNAEKQRKSLYYDGTKFIDIFELCEIKAQDGVDAIFVEDKVLVTCTNTLNNDSYTPTVSCYIYDSLDETVVQTVGERSLFLQETQPRGLMLYGSRHALFYNRDGDMMILDLLLGASTQVELKADEVVQVQDVGEQHFAVVLQSGQIALVQKSDGQIVKRTDKRLESTLGINIFYFDMHLYVEEIVDGYVYIY